MYRKLSSRPLIGSNPGSCATPWALQPLDRGRIEGCEVVSIVVVHSKRPRLQSVFQVLIDLHDSSLVTASVTVVGCYTR